MIWFFRSFVVPLHPMASHKNGWWFTVGCSLTQFIAECGIEYGRQFVTHFFLNPPDCLYTKKFCDFFQSYGKTSAEQNKLVCFLCRVRQTY